MTVDPENELTCDICENKIFPDEPHYELPDGFTVCEDSDCVNAWLSRYKTCGEVPLT